MDYNWVGAAIAAGGALVGEAVRLKTSHDRLAADMQKRNLEGGDPLISRRVPYPRGYFLSLLIYTVVAAAVAGFVDGSVPAYVHAYIGLSLPSFVGQVTRVAEPLIPGRIMTSHKDGGTAATIDSVSVSFGSQKYKRVKDGVFRVSNSLYYYLAG